MDSLESHIRCCHFRQTHDPRLRFQALLLLVWKILDERAY